MSCCIWSYNIASWFSLRSKLLYYLWPFAQGWIQLA